jgi:hypothetical protein
MAQIPQGVQEEQIVITYDTKDTFVGAHETVPVPQYLLQPCLAPVPAQAAVAAANGNPAQAAVPAVPARVIQGFEPAHANPNEQQMRRVIRSVFADMRIASEQDTTPADRVIFQHRSTNPE